MSDIEIKFIPSKRFIVKTIRVIFVDEGGSTSTVSDQKRLRFLETNVSDVGSMILGHFK